MDPFFFLTKHKNFIPHEYPCRTQFAAGRRGKRPCVTAEPSRIRIWLPFASPRVDLSGFWFRPTVHRNLGDDSDRSGLSGRCSTSAFAPAGARSSSSLAARSGGWLPTSEISKSAAEFRVALKAGRNEIRVWFDDLAERDARYYFQLDYLAGPAASTCCRFPKRAQSPTRWKPRSTPCISNARPITMARWRLSPDVPLPADAGVTVEIEGDFLSIGGAAAPRVTLQRRRTRLPIADAEDLPADFRHFKVTLADRWLRRIARPFGVEICHAARQGAAPADCRVGSTRRCAKSPSMPSRIRCGRWRGLATGAEGRQPMQ